jgi:proteic killer suppression protein
VIRSFRRTDAGRLFHRVTVRWFKAIERQALRKLVMLDAAPDLRTLSKLPGNRLERLKGDREDQYSMRINNQGDQWRICFEWRGGHAYEAEIVDYHQEAEEKLRLRQLEP